MNLGNTNNLFKKTIIIFWTIWWIIALWTDIAGGLKHLGVLTQTWALDSNYPFLVQSLSMYHPSSFLPPLFFCGILIWSTVSVIAFLWACCGLFTAPAIMIKRARLAFFVTLTYWLAFFLADQAVMNFDLEANHMIQGGFELLSFLAFELLPP